jgi:hypothetical protein
LSLRQGQLVCEACSVDAERTKIDGARFFALKYPAMRAVAGSDQRPAVYAVK